jgi:tetratricopeptide (TPR) repeat protein
MKSRVTKSLLLSLLLVATQVFPHQVDRTAASEAQAGALALKQGDITAAEQHFKAALKIDPTLAEVRANLGLAYYAEHNYQLAISQFRAALKQDPALQTPKAFLPLSLAAAGNCKEAMSDLSREFDFTSSKRLRRMVGLSLVRCRMQTGDSTDAVELVARLEADYPNDPDVLYVAGQLYGRLSNEAYMRLTKVAPHSARTYQVMASVAAANGDWQDAIGAYRQALRVDPELPDAHLQIAILMLTHSHKPDSWQEAVAELKEELKVDPASAQAEYEIGEAYRKHGRMNEAVEAFDRSLQLDPAAVPTRIGLAKALQTLGKKQEAIDTLLVAKETAPGDPDVHFLLAQLYRAVGQQAEARSELEAFERLKKSSEAPVEKLGR